MRGYTGLMNRHDDDDDDDGACVINGATDEESFFLRIPNTYILISIIT